MRKYILSLTAVLVISLNLYGFRSNTVFDDEIIKDINSNIDASLCEVQLQGCFCECDMSYEDIDNICNVILGCINENMGQVSLEQDDRDNYLLIFLDDDYKGSINIGTYKNTSKITVTASIKDEKLSYHTLESIESNFTKALNKVSSHMEYSLSVKSKILSNTVEEVKECILDKLNKNEAENTEVVEINNGYSIISNTGRNIRKKILNKEIDFNCAVVKYSSGCYLIIGTPEISLSY